MCNHNCLTGILDRQGQEMSAGDMYMYPGLLHYFVAVEKNVCLFRYNVIGQKVGTKWRKYMKHA